MRKTRNDLAWEKIFKVCNVLKKIENEGSFVIDAKTIKAEGNREPRLMAKFDHKNNLPEIFKENKLSILPITRGKYVIGPMKTHQDFGEISKEIYEFSPPQEIMSIDFSNITSETVALNSAFVSGMLHDFVGDEKIVPTLGGRMSSGDFAFEIERMDGGIEFLKVSNSQIELDGGFEGPKNLILTEVKMGLSKDFIIRQLYYPFRTWGNKIRKTIRGVFIIFSNNVFRFFEYRFEKPNNYNSLVLVKQKNYSFEDIKINYQEIIEVFNRVEIKEPPVRIPFPQADDFGRVINICELLFKEDSLERDEVTENYDFDPRQTNYYTDAGRYLGLIKKEREGQKISFSLTKIGREIFKMKYKEKQLRLVELILQKKPFKASFELAIKQNGNIGKNDIVEIMKDCKLGISGDTLQRRASTVRGWINWILSLQK